MCLHLCVFVCVNLIKHAGLSEADGCLLFFFIPVFIFPQMFSVGVLTRLDTFPPAIMHTEVVIFHDASRTNIQKWTEMQLTPHFYVKIRSNAL